MVALVGTRINPGLRNSYGIDVSCASALPSSVIDLRRSFWIPERTVAAIKKGDHTHLRKALKKAEVSSRSFPLTRGRVSGRTGCQDAPQPHRSDSRAAGDCERSTAGPLHGDAGFLAFR